MESVYRYCTLGICASDASDSHGGGYYSARDPTRIKTILVSIPVANPTSSWLLRIETHTPLPDVFKITPRVSRDAALRPAIIQKSVGSTGAISVAKESSNWEQYGFLGL